MTISQTRPRARRYRVEAAVRFTAAGVAWQDGWMLEMSRSGALWETSGALPSPGDRVEFIVHLPVFGAAGNTHIRCTGHVIRTDSPGRVIASIEEYEFAKSGSPDRYQGSGGGDRGAEGSRSDPDHDEE